jgi:hypothetical protein
LYKHSKTWPFCFLLRGSAALRDFLKDSGNISSETSNILGHLSKLDEKEDFDGTSVQSADISNVPLALAFVVIVEKRVRGTRLTAVSSDCSSWSDPELEFLSNTT